jgi:DNA-binding transcriptional regulator YiaG
MPEGTWTHATPAILALVKGLYASGDARAIRVSANLSIRQFARLASVSSSVVHYYERGQHEMTSPETARRLLNALVTLGLVAKGF